MKNKETSENSNSNIVTEEDGDDSLSVIEIKRQKLNTLNIDEKLYLKVINYIIANTQILKEIKSQKNILKYTQITQTEDEIFTKDSTQTMQEQKNLIVALKNENNIYKNEIENNKKQIKDIEERYENLKTKYITEIEEKNKIITSIMKELEDKKKTVKELQNQMVDMKRYSPAEQALDNEKCVEKIMSYLQEESYLTLFSANKRIHTHLYFKYKYKYIEKKFFKAQAIISEMTSKDISRIYNIDEEEIINLINKYSNNHLIPGNPMRNSLFNSMTFLENIVRKPLQEQYDPKNEDNKNKVGEKLTNKAKSFFNELYSAVSDKKENIIGKQVKKQIIQKELNKKIISIDKNIECVNNNKPLEENKNLKKVDKQIIDNLNNDKFINIKFEFTSSNDIKTLLNYFIKAGLDKKYYDNFYKYLIDEFCELLYNGYECTSAIRELEIVFQALDVRYKRNSYIIKEMSNEIENLNEYVNSNKTTKEQLLKQKNDVDVKYNNSLMINSALNKKLETTYLVIQQLESDKQQSEKDNIKLKEKIKEDYNKIEKNFNILKDERNTLIHIFSELKNFFINALAKNGEVIKK